MLVTLDATPLVAPSAGVGRYVDELVRGLADLALPMRLAFPGGPSDERRRLLATRYGLPDEALASWRVPTRLLQAGWHHLGGPPIEWWVGDCPLFHATAFVAPAVRRGRVVTTIHDMTPLRFPAWHASAQRRVGTYMARSIGRSDLLIAHSHATAADMTRQLDVAPARIRVIPLAASSRFFLPTTDSERLAVRARHGLGERYFLAVGTLEPRKNLTMLLAAYRRLPPSLRAETPLVLAGSRGWLDAPIARALAETPEARWIGRVDDPTLSALLSGATAFAFPSLHEGFGLPVLEAMAAGAPVVASDASSIPEVAGEAAWLLAPDDVEGWTEALRRLSDDPALRRRMSEAGRRQAARFSWARVAAETLACYREALAL